MAPKFFAFASLALAFAGCGSSGRAPAAADEPEIEQQAPRDDEVAAESDVDVDGSDAFSVLGMGGMAGAAALDAGEDMEVAGSAAPEPQAGAGGEADPCEGKAPGSSVCLAGSCTRCGSVEPPPIGGAGGAGGSGAAMAGSGGSAGSGEPQPEPQLLWSYDANARSKWFGTPYVATQRAFVTLITGDCMDEASVEDSALPGTTLTTDLYPDDPATQAFLDCVRAFDGSSVVQTTVLAVVGDDFAVGAPTRLTWEPSTAPIAAIQGSTVTSIRRVISQYDHAPKNGGSDITIAARYEVWGY